MRLPEQVTICEVGPWDDLQNERANVPTAGIRRMEATSFVSPRWIPTWPTPKMCWQASGAGTA